MLDIDTTEWTILDPQSPEYLFIPQNQDLKSEYEKGWKLADIMLFNSVGVVTGQDQQAIAFNHQDAESLCYGHELPVDIVVPLLYRSFDQRLIIYDSKVVTRPRSEVMRHMLSGNNLGLITTRKTQDNWDLLITERICGHKSCAAYDINYLFPLYLYPDTKSEQGNLLSNKTLNLSQDFLKTVHEELGYVHTPETILHYAYAVFHSRIYRQRSAEFLKKDFPRLPLTSNDELFKALAEKGQELVKLHLMKSKKLNKFITKYQGSGDNAVTEVTYKPAAQQVWINKQQHFEGIAPEVWEFKIGGYQVLDKWLKDRKKAKRCLSFDEILHYQRVVVALKETMQIMIEIDQLIPGWPLE